MTLEPKGPSDDGGGKPPNQQPELVLARWSTRFWAWLVDFVIVIVATEIIFAIAYAPLAFNQGIQDNPALGAAKYAVQSLLFFGYWLYFESTSVQSIGKKLLAKRKKRSYRELWQGLSVTNRCVLWLDIHKRKEAEAV